MREQRLIDMPLKSTATKPEQARQAAVIRADIPAYSIMVCI
jgi:hypothetical protein